MPSLGFLKKKKTKDSSPDQSIKSPTSPVKISHISSPFSSSPSATRSPIDANFPANPSNSAGASAASAAGIAPSASSNSHQAQTPIADNTTTNPTLAQHHQYNQQQPPQSGQYQQQHQIIDNDNTVSTDQLPSSTPSDPSSAISPMNSTQVSAQTTQNVPSIQSMLNTTGATMDGSASAAQRDTPRETKGKYTLTDFAIQRTLGTGSFGRVHLVQSKHNQRFYAIKVLKKAQVVKMKQIEHTNDERKMLQRVKHPFLITLWGTFQDARNLYMVMDFIEGGELFSLLRKSQRFPNPVAKFYAAEVVLALEYLHSLNIIYRDLKPENLLLDRHGHLKITDFGFAKEVPDITWTLCGTPDYLAPEVVSSKGYNKSVDWWSLGILIFEMLCGFTPFWDGGSPMKIYENILKGRVKYPPYINPDAQDLLSKLITADLTKRLGNLVNGSKDIMNHPWFAEVTWDRLMRKDIDAPYMPPIKAGAGDASQFDKYPEETEAYGQAGDDPYHKHFLDF